MVDIRPMFFSTIQGDLTGLPGAACLFFPLVCETVMVVFGTQGTFADAYHVVAGNFPSGIVPRVIPDAGYLTGTIGIDR